MKNTNTMAKLFSVVILCCLALFVASCGPEAEGTKPVELAPTTVNWVTWDSSSEAEQFLVRKFRESYPQIEFKRTAMNNGIDYYLEQTPRPDLINLDAGYDLQRMIRSGAAADLTELWDQAGLFEAVPTSLQSLGDQDGKQFYVPVAVGWYAIYYNQAIFDQYGLEPPQTWDDFLNICETLLANGEIPLAMSSSDPYLAFPWFEYLDLRLNGATFHAELLAGKERFDDPRVRRVLETWRSLFDNGYVVENPQTLSGMTVATALVRDEKGMLRGEKAIMALLDTYNIGGLPAPFLSQLGFFRFPVIDSAVPVAEAFSPFGYAAPLGADHLPATMAFLTYLSSAEAQTAVAQYNMFQGTKYAPVRKDVATDQLSADQRQGIELVQNTEEAILPFWASMPRQMFGTVEYELRRFVEKGDIDKMILKFEEARQSMIDQGLLTPNE